MKKGFTLIELLTVIVILAIIALISIPYITDIVKSAQKGTFKASVNGVLKAAEYDSSQIMPGTCIAFDIFDFKNKEQFKEGQVCKDVNHELTVQNLCSISYCATGPNDNLVITEIANEPKLDVETLPILKARNSTYAFHTAAYTAKILSITVVTNNLVPANATESWDMSASNDGSVMAWVISDVAVPDNYHLFIGDKNGVMANSNMTNFFQGFTVLTTLDLTHLYTDKTTNMNGMFRGSPKIVTLDLTNFNTINVNNMASMFQQCSSLTNLDVTSFNTEKVTNISYMFYLDDKITTLDLSSFKTPALTSTNRMFAHARGIEALNLDNFVTTSTTNMSAMFYNNLKLKYLNLKSFDTRNTTVMDSMFYATQVMTKIDVTTGKWDTSKANVANMFVNSSVTGVTYND